MRLPYDERRAEPKQTGILVGLVIAALLPRAWLAARAGIIEHDGAHYAGLAATLLRGDWSHGLSPVWPPLYPGFIAMAALPFAAVRGTLTPEMLETVARGVSVVSGVLALVPLAAIARRVLGPREAWIPVALAATHPRLIQYSASALTEATFILLLLVAMALVMASGRERRAAVEGVAGAAFGLAYLVRPEGILMAGAVWLARALGGTDGRATRGWGAAARARLQPWFVAGLLLAALPYLAWLNGRLGHVTLGEKGAYNLWREHRAAYDAHFDEPAGLSERVFESPELADRAPHGQVELAPFLAAEPIAVARRSLANLARIVVSSLPAAVYLPWLLPVLAGLPLLARRELRPLVAVLVATPLIYAPFSVDRRFFVPLVPLLMLPAAAGMVMVVDKLAPPRRRLQATGIVVALLCVYGLGYAAFRPLMDDAPEHRAAGTWLRNEWPRLASGADETGAVDPGAARPIVVSRKTWVGYYAGGLIAELPDGDLESLRERVRRKQADVLVVDERWGVATRPWLQPLLEPARAPEGMKLLWRTDSPRRLLLYDVRDWR